MGATSPSDDGTPAAPWWEAWNFWAFALGLLAGLAVFLLFGGRCTGCVPAAGNLILQTRADGGRHLHHWVLFSLLGLLVLVTVLLSSGSFTPPVTFLLGFALGSVLTGFRYRDWKDFHHVAVTPRGKSVVYQTNAEYAGT